MEYLNFWRNMAFLRKKINKHKITAELLFCSMVSNFPWETSHPNLKARRIRRQKSMVILSGPSMHETNLNNLYFIY